MRANELYQSIKDTRTTFDAIADNLYSELFYLDQLATLYEKLKHTHELTPACEVEFMQLGFQFDKILIDLESTKNRLRKVLDH